MLETKAEQKEFVNENIRGISISVEDKLAKLFVAGVMSYDEPSFAEYTKEEVREFISLLLDVYDYMDMQLEEDNQMKLFDENEENELETEEFVVDSDVESETPNEFSEIIANSTAFLYMTEDYENDRISKVDIIQALHILRDSIESYLTSQDMKEDGQE